MMRSAIAFTPLAALVALAVLSGCERAKQDMYDQARYKPYAKSQLFEDGASARTAPEGTQPRARGAFAESSGGRVGGEAVQTDIAAERARSNPYPVDLALLRRGQEHYTIYCMPCHSPAGDGDGLVVRRGFPPPPTYHQDRLRNAPDRHLYDVIRNGYGVMVSYGDRVEPADRWAIVAYIRALQLSQYAQVAKLPADTRARLAALAPGQTLFTRQPDAIAQPNQQIVSPPERQPLTAPAGEIDTTPAVPSAAVQPIPQSQPGKTAPQLPAAIEARVPIGANPHPRSQPGPDTGEEKHP
jgi:mono/diheme cytochrome c family protein